MANVILWFFASIGFYMIGFYTKYVPVDNIFIVQMLTAAADILSRLVNAVTLKYLSYKVATMIWCALGAAVGVLFISFHNIEALVVLFFFLVKFFMGLIFSSMYITSVILFDTSVAITAFNLATFTGKIGAVIAPFIAEIDWFDEMFPMMVLILCSAASFGSVFFFRVMQQPGKDNNRTESEALLNDTEEKSESKTFDG